MRTRSPASADTRDDSPAVLSDVMGNGPILGFATQGAGGNEEDRLRALLKNFRTELVPFDRRAKRRMSRDIFHRLASRRFALAVMEGTGVAGGLAVLMARMLRGIPYVVSSGDAVGPYLTNRWPWLRPAFGLYERVLYRFAAGFIGWTPYLTGRALEFGAPRAMTAPGWAPFPRDADARATARARVRAGLGIAPDTLVIGIVGSLAWTRRVGYCYGYELVEAMARTARSDVCGLIVGDGDGRARLSAMAGPRLGTRVFLIGRVSQRDVPDYLAAMDVASLPQSVDRVGGFRYTTKLSEYLDAGLPVVTGQIPMAYDLDDGWLWRLPGRAPWDARYLDGLAELLDRLTPADLAVKRAAVPRDLPEFDRARQVARVTSFLLELLEDQCRLRLATPR